MGRDLFWKDLQGRISLPNRGMMMLWQEAVAGQESGMEVYKG